jgi:hypothetical protein
LNLVLIFVGKATPVADEPLRPSDVQDPKVNISLLSLTNIL